MSYDKPFRSNGCESICSTKGAPYQTEEGIEYIGDVRVSGISSQALDLLIF